MSSLSHWVNPQAGLALSVRCGGRVNTGTPHRGGLETSTPQGAGRPLPARSVGLGSPVLNEGKLLWENWVELC